MGLGVGALSFTEKTLFEPIQDLDKSPTTTSHGKVVFLHPLTSDRRRGEVHALESNASEWEHMYIWLEPHSDVVSKTQRRTLGVSGLEAFLIKSPYDFVRPDYT